MTYVERAKSMYERGDAPRAAFMFANGLVRDPENEDALNWLLMLYVEKIEKPGMERDVLRVLDTQRDGLELYELVETRLSERGEAEKIDALRKMKDRGGFLREVPSEDFSSEEVYWDEPSNEEPPASSHHGRDVQNVPESEPDAPSDDSSTQEVVGDAQQLETPDEDWNEFDDPFEERSTNEGGGFRRTTATTGVYSSLNAISEEHAREELREYYVRRRKIQIIIGLVFVSLVAATLIFAFPAESTSGEDEAQAPSQSEAE